MTSTSKSIEQLVAELNNAQDPNWRYNLPGNPVVLPGNPVVLPGIPIELPGIPVDPHDKGADLDEMFKKVKSRHGVSLSTRSDLAFFGVSSKKLLKDEPQEKSKPIDRDKDGIEWDGKYAILRQREMFKPDVCRAFGLDVHNFNLLNSDLANTNTIPIGRKINVVLKITNKDNKKLALLAYAEGDFDPSDKALGNRDKRAIVTVVLNRMEKRTKNGKYVYGETIDEIITKKEFMAVDSKKWKEAQDYEFYNIASVCEWNLSAMVAERRLINDEIRDSVIFHSFKTLGENKQIKSNMIDKSMFKAVYVTNIGKHYYFELEELSADELPKNKK